MQFRCLLAGVVLMLGGTACSGGDDEASPLTTTSSVVPASTTTTAATTTTLAFETEVKLAALELIELRNEVFQNPDVARVDEYIAETCVCLERERQIVDGFAQAQQRWTGPPIVPLAIRLDRGDPANPAFMLIARQPAGEIVGPESSQPVAEVELAPHVVSLVRNEHGDWRINGLEGIRIERDAALSIIEEHPLP